ncbi:hypothetical protein GCM10022215_18040 [Nocardioides fonticola]|uniref:HK97 gp10 family phage protein n=1 Tax=Nocardioides fonticola TaxID=450363 RepID=A0ABP7XIM6_9ACTN
MVTGLRYSSGAERLLDHIGRNLADRRGLLDVIAEEGQDYGREVFASGGFGSWAPDSLHTVDLKGSSRVLVDTGRLMSDVTGAPGVSESAETVTVGSDAPYVGYLKGGANGAPRRDPTPQPSAQRVTRVAERLLDHVVGGVR